MQRILRLDYRPNMEDVLRARVRTTGISDTEFISKGVRFRSAKHDGCDFVLAIYTVYTPCALP